MKKLSLITTLLLAVITFSQPTLANSKVAGAAKAKAKVTQSINKVNLNTAGAKEIADTLTGVGLKKAVAIVDYRKAHGKFKTIGSLAAVKGIGVATIAKNEGRILLK